MNNKKTFNRRQFIRHAAIGSAALAIPTFIPSSALGGDGSVAPSNRITLGAIGVGSQGTGDMWNLMAQKDCRVVAVCDVKSNILKDRQDRVNNHYGETGSGCRAYGDFRELLACDDIDAVLIANCDHWHVLTAIAAAKAGKDMYLEKPIGLTVAEGQALRKAVKRYDRIFQFGTQQRSSWQFLLACELVQNKKIGDLKSINLWSPGGIQAGDPTPVPVPDWLDYDMWLGPAPSVPYTADRCSNSLWWYIYDYAVGFIDGWGIHPMDIAMWAAGSLTDCPCYVEGTAKFPTEGVCNTAMNWDVKINYDSGININFTGVPYPEQWSKRYRRTTDHGTAFEGTDGWVHVDRQGINAYPESILQTRFTPKDKRLYKSNDHFRNFLDCVKSRTQTICPIDDAVRADFACQISDIAIRVGEKLRWDPKKEKFIDNSNANRRLSRSLRSPWTLSV